MRRFQCPSCGHEVFFASTVCLSCGISLVYSPGKGFQPSTGGAVHGANRAGIAYDWAAGVGKLCLSCCHTTMVPDPSVDGNTERWSRIEAAKRPVIRALHHLRLPLADAQGRPAPVFELKGDSADPAEPRVLTGHDNGTITLNIAEADDSDPSTPDRNYSFEPGAEALLDSLLPKYVATRIHAALLDSSASESAARRTAMKAATDNAEELSKSLSREANQLRQAQITQELSEIVGGTAALS